MEKIDCSKCRQKCSDNISGDERQGIFDIFYGLKNYMRQKDYVCRHVEQKNTRTLMDEHGRPVKKTRLMDRKYFLTVKGERMQVCKRFFQATLAVKHSYIYNMHSTIVLMGHSVVKMDAAKVRRATKHQRLTGKGLRNTSSRFLQ